MNRYYRNWLIAYWILYPLWIAGALLFMNRVNGGFFTNYLSDIAFPPWFYIHIRGLQQKTGTVPNLLIVKQWFGLTPERAALSIFLVGVITEVKTKFWPGGILAGTFDGLDIAAYGFGLLLCYIFDKKTHFLKQC